MPRVCGLGYVVVNATDLEAWRNFAAMLGMQVAHDSSDRLVLRLDSRAWRFDVRRADIDGPAVLGWELPGPEDLAFYAEALESHGYAVERSDAEAVKERNVSAFVRFKDPDGLTLELFYGQKKDATHFVSPTGINFVTGEFGMGHAMQFVSDSVPFRELYMDILGFKLSDYMDVGPDPGTFLHCNPRHHSMAFAAVPWIEPKLGHIMLEVDDMDAVGRAYDQILAGNAVLGSSLGKHTNDEMTSFYVQSPSGFEIEYGFGGIHVDDATWTPGRWDTPNIWGHKRLQDADAPRI